jgi:Spy/CpxP family protein refolding chaperone
MSDMNSQPSAAPAQPAAAPAKRGFFSSRWFIVSAVILTGVVGFGLGKLSHLRQHMGFAMMMSGKGDPAKIQARVEHRLNRVLSTVDATEDQKKQITAIILKRMNDMQPLRQVRNEVREKLATALKSPRIDRAGIEQLRTQQLQLAENMSKGIQDSLLEAAEILSPSQRVALIDRWQARRWRG